MSHNPADLPQGTLDLLILKTLQLEPLHGWAIAKRIQQLSRDALSVQQGSLYPALYRLQDRGWIRSKVAEADSGRPIKVYRLTAAGKRQLEEQLEGWRQATAAVNRVLDAVLETT